MVVEYLSLFWKNTLKEWPHEVSLEGKGFISNNVAGVLGGQPLVVAVQQAVGGY